MKHQGRQSPGRNQHLCRPPRSGLLWEFSRRTESWDGERCVTLHTPTNQGGCLISASRQHERGRGWEDRFESCRARKWGSPRETRERKVRNKDSLHHWPRYKAQEQASRCGPPTVEHQESLHPTEQTQPQIQVWFLQVPRLPLSSALLPTPDHGIGPADSVSWRVFWAPVSLK